MVTQDRKPHFPVHLLCADSALGLGPVPTRVLGTVTLHALGLLCGSLTWKDAGGVSLAMEGS